MSKQESISFFEFKEIFNNEDRCRDHLFKLRWPNGFECQKCGSKSYYSITTRDVYECCDCHYQASVTAGTVMEGTHLSLEKWFWGIYFVSTDKRGHSATALQRKLGIGYKAAWYMRKRIRTAMMSRDWEYMLSGIVELDDTFFGSADEGGKRGRGTNKAKVIVGLSIDGKGRPQYAKMEVVNDFTQDTISAFAQANIEADSTISSDAYSSYRQLKNEGYRHEYKVFNPKTDTEHLKWLHTIVSNAKAFINGTFHGLDRKHLQLYLAEFCYRFNRRFNPAELFNRLLVYCLSSEKTNYTELTT
jgi:transposase-like protein